MAKNTQVATATANELADEIARNLDDGYIRIYTGSQPANANTALSGQTLLCELRFADPCADAAVNGVLTFEEIESAVAAATGTATWFRCLAADGSTVVADGSVAATGGDANMIIASTSITALGTVVVDAFSITVLRSYTGL